MYKTIRIHDCRLQCAPNMNMQLLFTVIHGALWLYTGLVYSTYTLNDATASVYMYTNTYATERIFYAWYISIQHFNLTRVNMNFAGIPAEFNHIDKWRIMYKTGSRQSLRMKAGHITAGINDMFNNMLHGMYCQWLCRCNLFAIHSEWGW